MKHFGYALMAATAASVAIAAPAHADGLYGNLGYTHWDLEDVTPGTLTGRLGYNLSENLALEGELSLGVLEDDVTESGVKVDVNIESAYGAFVVGKLPVAEGTTLFGRLGYGSVTAEGSALGVTVENSIDGFAFGLGGEYAFTNGFGVRGEYTRLDGDDGDADTFSISAVFNF